MTSADVAALNTVNKQIAKIGQTRSSGMRDYYPMLDSDAYGDYALNFC